VAGDESINPPFQSDDEDTSTTGAAASAAS